MDPRYYGQKLTANSMSIISQFIQRYYPSKANTVWRQLIEYKTKTGIFNLQLAWETVNNVDPVAWWKGNFEQSAPELCKVAIRILSIPSSSAASERNWSAFSYIQEKKRARLTNERIFKLVYIYSNYKLSRPRKEFSDIANAIARFNNRLSQDSNSQEDAEPLDPTDDDLNDSYDEILVEDGSELLEDLEEINSEDIDSDEAENDR